MRLIQNKFGLKADPDLETSHTLKNGVKIWLSPPVMGEQHKHSKVAFSPYERAVQIAEIAYLPMSIHPSLINDVELKVGDMVACHHFCIQPENLEKIGDQVFYRAFYQQLFCVIRDGEIIPLQDFIFCTPVYEDESKCKTPGGLWIKDKPDQLERQAKVEFVCKSAKDKDIYVGDTIHFMTNSDYWINIGGVKYWRMSVKRVNAKNAWVE